MPPPEPLDQWSQEHDGPHLLVHGTAVVEQGKGVLILGPSGSGKSSLALALMAHGAQLIADDMVMVDGLTLVRPEAAPPLIEARGVGLLHAGPVVQTAPLDLVIDLARPEPHRLPPKRLIHVAGQNVPLILGAEQMTLAPMVLQLLRFSQADR